MVSWYLSFYELKKQNKYPEVWVFYMLSGEGRETINIEKKTKWEF